MSGISYVLPSLDPHPEDDFDPWDVLVGPYDDPYDEVDLIKLANLEAALEASDRALGVDPENAAAWLERVGVPEDLGRCEEALEAHERGSGNDPDAQVRNVDEMDP